MKYRNLILATVVGANRAFLMFALASSLLYGCSTTPNQTSQAAPATFTGLHLHPTNGYVGYHMVSHGAYDAASIPCAADQHPGRESVSVIGTLPPGLLAPDASQGRNLFEGTPQQAGDWDVQVTDHGCHCMPGGTVNYGDRTAAVHFHIDPGSKFQRIQ